MDTSIFNCSCEECYQKSVKAEVPAKKSRLLEILSAPAPMLSDLVEAMALAS